MFTDEVSGSLHIVGAKPICMWPWNQLSEKVPFISVPDQAKKREHKNKGVAAAVQFRVLPALAGAHDCL